MMKNSSSVTELAERILTALGPIIDRVETGIAVSALLNVATQTAMLGLKCDQETAIELIAATFARALPLSAPTEH